MFIEEKPIEVVVHYRKVGRGYIAYTDAAFTESKLDDLLKAKYKKVKVSMKPLNWELYNELQDQAFQTDEKTGKRKFNYKLYKERKLLNLIIGWDAVTLNEKGETVPIVVNEKNIMSLSPDIAEAILEGYDSESLMSEDEEKK